jgi:hypothetical protein
MTDLEKIRNEIRTYLSVKDSRYGGKERRELAINDAAYIAYSRGDCVVELYNKGFDLSMRDFIGIFDEEVMK